MRIVYGNDATPAAFPRRRPITERPDDHTIPAGKGRSSKVCRVNGDEAGVIVGPISYGHFSPGANISYGVQPTHAVLFFRPLDGTVVGLRGRRAKPWR